ncbi:MAG TPA: DNA repair protein RecO, partial [Bacillota bacterium]|nr:DNA repair protein RecO [Bacillota bacterium]
MEFIEGLILKKLDYKENSKIIYIYTDQGLKSVLVHGSKNIKSPFLNLVRVMNHVGLHVTGKDLKTLKDGDVINDYRALKNDLEKFTYGLHILELVYHFATHDHDHQKLYQFLLKIFDIADIETNYIPYFNMVELKLLHLLGVNPLFKHCVSCERTDQLQFSIAEGGMCCPDHFVKSERQVSEAAIRAMMTLYYFDLQNPEPLKIEEATYR